MQHVLFIPFLIASAATFALLEIQLVGGAGRAEPSHLASAQPVDSPAARRATLTG